jgi:hypothetical protein
MKKPKKQTAISYDEYEDDFNNIWAYLDEQYIALNKVAARLPVPMRVERRSNPRAQTGSIGEVVEAALKTIWKKRDKIAMLVWRDLSDIYMNTPRAKKIVVGDHEEWRSIGNTSIHLPHEALALVNEIALYMRQKGISVPRMLRSGTGSPRVISAIAVIYTSRYAIPEIKREQALRKFR